MGRGVGLVSLHLQRHLWHQIASFLGRRLHWKPWPLRRFGLQEWLRRYLPLLIEGLRAWQALLWTCPRTCFHRTCTQMSTWEGAASGWSFVLGGHSQQYIQRSLLTPDLGIPFWPLGGILLYTGAWASVSRISEGGGGYHGVSFLALPISRCFQRLSDNFSEPDSVGSLQHEPISLFSLGEWIAHSDRPIWGHDLEPCFPLLGAFC